MVLSFSYAPEFDFFLCLLSSFAFLHMLISFAQLSFSTAIISFRKSLTPYQALCNLFHTHTTPSMNKHLSSITDGPRLMDGSI